MIQIRVNTLVRNGIGIVKVKHVIARSYYLIWKHNNKPLASLCYDNMVIARKYIKYELRHSKLICKQIEADNIAFKFNQ